MEVKDKVITPDQPKGLKAIKAKVRRMLSNPKDQRPEYLPPSVFYDFPLLHDPAFNSSPLKPDLEGLDLKKQTITITEEVMRDLEIMEGFRVITEYSQKPDDQTPVYIETGIGAVVTSPTEIHFQIDPTNPQSIEAIMTRRERQIAHELNHAARFQTGQTPHNLLDFVVGEGLAVFYEEHWKGEFQPSPWRKMVDEKQVQEAWQIAQPHLEQTSPLRDRWFNGKEDLPTGVGYTLGAKIVEGYFANNPNSKMRDVIKLPSSEILQKSGFTA